MSKGRVVAVVLALLLVAALWATSPTVLAPDDLPEYAPNAAAGERMFWAGGCASCHATPVEGKRAQGEARLVLGGGMELHSPYGTFHVPNISPHADGIGGWSTLEFVNAMQRGVAPDGRHYYPSFPYASYVKMRVEDVIDLKAYLDTLEPVPGSTRAHELGFPWNLRRGLGAWKRLYVTDEPVVANSDETVERGRYLVEGVGHCGECHTPRNLIGGMKTGSWLGGAPNPEGKGTVPNLTPGSKSFNDWSLSDIAYYLETGFTPDFDSVGGTMVAVQENMAKLSAEDRIAIAAYLKAVPAVD